MVPIGCGSTKSVYAKVENNCYTENTFYMKQAVFEYMNNSAHLSG